MLTLQGRLTLTEAVAKAADLTDRFVREDLTALGGWVWEGYDADKQSRAGWEKRMQAAMDLALQLQKTKTFPWQGAANVAFPLVTIAALQFHARAYPATVSGTEVVRMRVTGADEDGALNQRAHRVGRFLSYQVLEADEAWEEQHDRLLLNLPIMGCTFKKTTYSPAAGCPTSEMVSATDLVMDYFAKSVETCQRKTHVIYLSRNEVYERVRSGLFRDILDEGWYRSPQVPDTNVRGDVRRGETPPSAPDEATPICFLEQHCWIDLDGDGYAEPYIATIEEGSKCLVRLVARWERSEDVERDARSRVIRINASEYFTKYGLIPSPDGSVYDLGFGILLGPLNESVNSIVNQLMDAGTMQVAAGGFLAKGIKIRSGDFKFSPFGYQRVDASGEDLQKGVFPFPVREPSAVLFQLLSLLINYTQRISGSTDMLAGENPGQNTPAETTREMVEQGMKIYNSLFKRVWRSMKREFKIRYKLNGLYLGAVTYFGGAGDKALIEDFQADPNLICPVADPNVASDGQRVQQMTLVKQAAAATRGYNLDEVEREWLRALKVDGIDRLFVGSDKTPPTKDPRIAVAELKAETEKLKLQQEQQLFMIELMSQREFLAAQILELQARAAKLGADAANEGAQQTVSTINAMIGLMKTQDDALHARADRLLKAKEIEQNAKQPQPG